MSAELTVRELALQPSLDLRIAVGGPGLDRPVRWAHSTELLDPRAYLHGGELILTVGAGLTGPERCRAFARSLADCRVAAVGLGVGDIHQEPPAALIEGCEEAGIPLLVVPPTTPFIEITELLAEHRIRLASDRSHRETIGRLFMAIAQGHASPEVLRADIHACGLGDHLVLSLWDPSEASALELRVADLHHLIGDGAAATVLLTDAEDARAGQLTGAWSSSLASETFALTDLASVLEPLLARWSRRSEAGDVAAASDAARGHYTYLVNSMPLEALEPITSALIAPLQEHDHASGTHLLRSLESFLEHDGSVQATARTMHLHANSLRYRLSKVHELTGRNPLLFRDQVDFAIALEAHHRMQKVHRRAVRNA
jgi:hypothetical protein